MSSRRLLAIAYRDLGRNRRRSLLSLMAVGLGLALLIMMNGLIAGVVQDSLQSAIRLQTGHLQLRRQTYDEEALSLSAADLLDAPDALVERASALPQVAAATPVLWAATILATAEDSVNLRLQGIDPGSPVYQPVRDSMTDGQFLSSDDRSGVLLGSSLAKSLGVATGQKVQLAVADADGNVEQGPFTVRGLFSTGIATFDEGTVLMPLAKAQAFSRATGRASAIVIMLHDQEDAEAVATALAGDGVEAVTWRQLNQLWLDALQTGTAFYAILDIIVMLVVAVVIANTLLMSVFERVREMGILAALGMKGRQIVTMLLVEAGILGVAGIVLGVVLGALAVAYLARFGIYIGSMASVAGNMALGTTMYARFEPRATIWMAGWTFAIILLASLYPAWFASRLEPVDALHQQ
jgi:ABC-type lipoprotein release transport system permease subunit